MKKFFKAITFVSVVICATIFVGCGNKKDNLSKISQNLSNYYMDISYNNQTKTLYAEQTLEYVNNIDALLK